ncbi:ABC transporter substrate-binding protein [Amycolatopsis sp. RM579]|uniref:ABC transporter substrate-binding protein n=1 Tax=Amycolatopsis pithecellobii TaxID=664692 RepID=A0A6N7Z4Z1_9PSEU|nr:ABC transporter substrate-binding protein [Amycolatopsis pithecellobii]
MEAAVEPINAAGGVKGRPLRLTVCDSQFTVNGEMACTRKLVAAKPSAIVAPFLAADQSGGVFKILETEKLPVVGGQGGSPAEMNSPVSYPLGSAFMGPYQGAALGMVRAGATSVTVLADSPNPAGSFATDLITNALHVRGITKVKRVTAYPAADPTFATAAAQAGGDGVDGIVLDATSNSNAKLVRALRSGGYTGAITVPALLFPASSIGELGSLAEGIVLDSSTAFPADTANPGVAAFLGDMHRYRPDAAVDDASLQAWSGVQLFAKVAAQASVVEPATLITTLDHLNSPIDIQTSGPWSVAGKLNTIPGFSRIVNPMVTFGTVRGGKVVPQQGGFENPF